MRAALYRAGILICCTALSTFWASSINAQEAPDPELRRLLIESVAQSTSFEHKYDAEVWLMDMGNRLKPTVPDTEYRLELLRHIHSEATLAGLRPELVLAVIDVESRFDRFAVSVAGAQGLMQIMPFWLEEIGRPNDNLFDVRTNLRMGCTILKYYLEMEKGDLTRALARYNGSAGRFRYPILVFDALTRRWF